VSVIDKKGITLLLASGSADFTKVIIPRRIR
jgi:hypothetical protein